MNRREQVLIGVCVVFVIGAVWFALTSAFRPSGKGRLIPYARARSETVEAKVSARRMEAEEKSLQPRVNEMIYNQPSETVIPIVIGELQVIAERSGVHIREVKPIRPKAFVEETTSSSAGRTKTRTGPIAHQTLGARIPMEVRFRARFQPNVMRFLYDVENPAGRMVVDKVSITSADDTFKTVEVSAQITVFTRSSAGTAAGDAGDTSDAQSNRG